MSETDHRTALHGLCRLCGKTIKRRKIDKRLKRTRNLIKNALKLDINTDDENIHPTYICEPCEQKLVRWKNKCAKKGKEKGGLSTTKEINIMIAKFSPHNIPCSVCQDSPLLHDSAEQSEDDSLLSACESIGPAHGMISRRRASKVLLISLDDDGNSSKCLAVRQTGQWTFCVYGHRIPIEKTHFKDYEEIIKLDSLELLVKEVSESSICPGNSEYLLPESIISNRPVYTHIIPEPSKNTLRHNSCPIVSKVEGRCSACKIYRSDLAKLHKSHESTTSPAVKTNHRFMKHNKLAKRLKIERRKSASMNQKLAVLKAQMSAKFNKESSELGEKESQAFAEVLRRERQTVEEKFVQNSPQRLLWDEQVKCLSRKSKGMRWHPAIIRLCIALHAKSSAAYSVLRESGFLALPHQKTLYQYTHFTDNPPGFNLPFLKRICNDIKFSFLKSHEKNIIVSMDEMKISEGLVYSQKTGEISGFTDLGTMNREFLKYSAVCDKSYQQKFASHVLVLMVRATSASYKSAIAYFATGGATSDQMYWIVLESIEVLTHLGFCVRAIVSDGAAPNRGLYKLLTRSSQVDYFFNNPITGRPIYLFSDAPHLLKTIRNNVENSGFNQNTRNLMFRGLPITWKHIVDLYEWDLRQPSSLRMLHHLSEEHVHLNPALRMRVKLAAQVLSSTVANALLKQGKSQTKSTILFIQYIDKFFDCMNVSNPTEGVRKRKEALLPYRDQDDRRFKWLTEDFLGFLDEWESEGTSRKLTAKERDKLVMSRQTLQGIRMTVNSFVRLCKELLEEEGVDYVLSEKFNQDPLEQYFSKQRFVGRQLDNPSVSQFGNNMLTLHVAGSSIHASKRANVSTGGESSVDASPLPRKRICKNK